jgi:osmotically-inducible protein OsmY
MRSDEQLKLDVIDELRWDPAVGRSEIAVAAEEGVVTLVGRVDSYAKRIAAIRAAERVAGVAVVVDDIDVRLTADARRTDDQLAHAVAAVLLWDVEVPEDRVKAEVRKGLVTLDGEVDWHYQRAAAERAVRSLTGVTGVYNRLLVRKQPSIPDVRSRIEKSLARNAEIDARKIRVDTADGTVILRGTVRSRAERDDAERAAWSAPGVTRVRDEIAIQYDRQ